MRTMLTCLAVLLWPPPAAAVDLRNELGDDQLSESVEVLIDDRPVGRLSVDRKNKSAELRLPDFDERVRYRLRGEAVMADGSRHAIHGAGLIVRTAGMDRIGEAAEAEQALAAYKTLLELVRAAAPEADLSALAVHHGRPATAADLDAAQGRLGQPLPARYRDFVARHGSLQFGSDESPSGHLYAPGEVKTLQAFVLAEARKNDNDAAQVDAMRVFMDKRFPATRRDLVIARYEVDSPSVIRAGKRCAEGTLAYAFPESQWEVLMASSLDTNMFIGLVDYEDEIVGETQCLSFDQEFAYSLHDHLLEMGRDALFVLGPDERTLNFERRPSSAGKIWFRLSAAED